jgi:hypothetical protein
VDALQAGEVARGDYVQTALQFIVGFVVIPIGLILASNFKGLATRHIKTASALVRPATGRLRRGEAEASTVRRIAFLVRLDRAVGVLLVVIGIVLLVAAVSAAFSR